MIGCVPPPRLVVVRVACPEPFRVAVPRVAAPSLKTTVPVGVPAELVTVAVKVTDCPRLEGFREETRAVDVAAGFTT